MNPRLVEELTQVLHDAAEDEARVQRNNFNTALTGHVGRIGAMIEGASQILNQMNANDPEEARFWHMSQVGWLLEAAADVTDDLAKEVGLR